MATNTWVEIGGGGSTGSILIGNFDGQAAAANGLTAINQNLYAQSADATHPGMVNTTTQTFAGNKTFSGTVGASNISGTNTGDVTLTAVGAAPSANGATLSGQALTLQPADGTHPGLMTTGTQTIAGTKVFTGALQALSLAGNLSQTATSGFINMNRTQTVAWRNAANNADLSLSVDSSNNFVLGSGVQLGASSTTPTHIINSAVNTAGVGAGTLTNAPSSGNPAGYLTVTINGTTSYIPYWQ